MLMRMRLVFRSADNAINGISRTKRNQCPSGPSVTNGFEIRQLLDGKANRDAEKSERDGAQHVAHSANAGDERGPCTGPSPGPPHHDERQVVVRAQDSMKQSDRCGRGGQEPDALRQNVFPIVTAY